MLKLKVPPVAVTLLFASFVWLTDYFIPNESLSFIFSDWIAVIFSAIGGIIALLGVLEFRRKSTTVNPHKPQNTSSLVDSGIYSISRNPMYLGLFLMLFSWILFLGNIYGLIFLPLFIWYMNTFQIEPEEEFMQQKFGNEFEEYKTRVRRWL